jgi:hypothetical protein
MVFQNPMMKASSMSNSQAEKLVRTMLLSAD